MGTTSHQALPNLLILMSDQHSCRFLGCEDGSEINTPHLDALAADGVRLQNCYCGSPLCVPSRISWLTARACHKTGVWNNDHSLSSTVPTFAHGLGRAGYRTVLAGRMHFVGGDQHHGFQERTIGDVSSQHLGVNQSLERFRGYFYPTEAVPNAGPGRSNFLEYDRAVAADACRIIAEHEAAVAAGRESRPLAIVVSFMCPHDPYRVTAEYFHRHEGKIGLPVHASASAPDLHPYLAAWRELWEYGTFSTGTTLRARTAYAGVVSFVDDLCGQVLDRWRDSTLAEDNIIAYLSDHGELAGAHGLWAKTTYYEDSVRVPLIWHAPGRLPAGSVLSAPSSLLDFGPTLLDLVGAPPLPDTTGISLKAQLTGKVTMDADRPIFSELALPKNKKKFEQFPVSRMVRRGPWKLNHYDGMPPELYNLEEDPDELNDRAADPANAALIDDLEQALTSDSWCAQRVEAEIERRKPDIQYLFDWAVETGTTDSIQWGPAGPH